MSGPIQTIPQGLLSLLQLKQTGSNPSQLLETVAPVVDLVQWWLQRQVVDLSFQLFGAVSTVLIGPAGHGQTAFTTNPITVPQQQQWWIESFSLGGTLLAAEGITLAPLMLEAGGTTHLLGPPYADVVTARARDFAVSVRNFWLAPGSSLGVRVMDANTAATITVSGAIRGVALSI